MNKRIVLFILIIAILAIFLGVFVLMPDNAKYMPYNDFNRHVLSGDIKEVQISEKKVFFTTFKGSGE